MWYDTHVGGGKWLDLQGKLECPQRRAKTLWHFLQDQDNRGKPFIFSTIFSMTLVSLIILFLSSATTIGSLVANILADGPYAKLVRRRLWSWCKKVDMVMSHVTYGWSYSGFETRVRERATTIFGIIWIYLLLFSHALRFHSEGYARFSLFSINEF